RPATSTVIRSTRARTPSPTSSDWAETTRRTDPSRARTAPPTAAAAGGAVHSELLDRRVAHEQPLRPLGAEVDDGDGLVPGTGDLDDRAQSERVVGDPVAGVDAHDLALRSDPIGEARARAAGRRCPGAPAAGPAPRGAAGPASRTVGRTVRAGRLTGRGERAGAAARRLPVDEAIGDLRQEPAGRVVLRLPPHAARLCPGEDELALRAGEAHVGEP